MSASKLHALKSDGILSKIYKWNGNGYGETLNWKTACCNNVCSDKKNMQKQNTIKGIDTFSHLRDVAKHFGNIIALL